MGELEAVRPDQPGIAVGAVHEFRAEARADVAPVSQQIGDPPDSQPLGLVSPHQDREAVLEAEGIETDDVVAVLQLRSHSLEHRLGISLNGFLENRRQRGAGVFDVGVESSQAEGVVTDQGPAQVEPAVDPNRRMGLHQVGEHMPQENHLAAVLGADRDRGPVRSAHRMVEQPAPGGEGEQETDRHGGDPATASRTAGPGRVEQPLGLTQRRVTAQRQDRRGH